MKMKKKRVLMVGSAEESGGGVASVIRLLKKMPFWRERRCGWLGTQIQRNYLWKMWYALKAAIVAPFVIWKYDIVHFHTVPDRNGLLIQLPELVWAKLYRKKVVVHIHMGNQLEYHTGNSFFIWWTRKADLLVFLAKRWEKLFKEKYSCVDVKTAVLYNACDDVPEVDMNKKEKSIIMAAYFNDNKAPDVLLKAWQKIKDRFPDWKVTMMGNGEVERFRQMAHDMSLDESVTFTGYITGAEKKDVWEKASIYCMCSYNEGFPMVALEAWANKVALVTTPVGGLPDVIEEERNCLTFPFGDSDELANKLGRLMLDELLRRSMVEYSRVFVKKNFSLESVNTMATNLYNAL